MMVTWFGFSPSTEFATRKRMELMDDGDNCVLPRTRTKTDAVGYLSLSSSRRFSGSTIITRAAATSSIWLMVRESSPCTARV